MGSGQDRPRAWRRLRWWLPVLGLGGLVALQLTFPEAAFARGGGGGHSGGAGGSGGGHFGGGGGQGGGGGGVGGIGGIGGFGTTGGGLSPLALLGGCGLIVLVLLVLIMVILIGRRGRGPAALAGPPPSWGDPSQWIATPSSGPTPDPVEEGLAAIKQADPDFEIETFLQRAEAVFFLVTEAWQSRNPAGGRPYLADAAYATWSEQIAQAVRGNRKQVLENLNVRGLRPVVVSHNQSGDLIRVHIDYVAAPQWIDATSGRILEGGREDQRLGAEWTFQRGPGARTVVSGGVSANRCPNCGAPLELDEVGGCRHCRAAVSSGAFDWTLTAMDTAYFEEAGLDPRWGSGRSRSLGVGEGIAAIQQADPGFSTDAFLARARQAFTELQQAWQARRVDQARNFTSPGLYLSWSAQVRQLLMLGKINHIENLEILDASIVKVAVDDRLFDITVRFIASCADYEVDERTNRIIFGSRSPSRFTEYWTFQRSREATSVQRGLIEKTCPNCGAPLDINQVGECRYCNAAVTSGRFDWVLSRIDQEEEWSG